MLKSLSSSIRLQSYEELSILPIFHSNFLKLSKNDRLLIRATALDEPAISSAEQPIMLVAAIFDKGAFGGSIDIDPEPFQASRMA